MKILKIRAIRAIAASLSDNGIFEEPWGSVNIFLASSDFPPRTPFILRTSSYNGRPEISYYIFIFILDHLRKRWRAGWSEILAG